MSKEIIWTSLMMVAVILMGLAQVIAIGETLYRWGALDWGLGMSAWEGFKTWMTMMVIGFPLLIMGILMRDY